MSARQRKRRDSRRREHSERTPTRRRLLAAGGLTAGATLALAGSAHAAPATYYVGTDDDDSTVGSAVCTTPSNTTCSLREALDLANATTDADTILFNSNLTGDTIGLAGGPLYITKAVSIDGNSTGATIDGYGGDRVFYIDGSNEYYAVSLSGLTMQHGQGSYNGLDNGGVIDNEDANLTISNSVIRQGYVSGNAAGGGVWSQEGSLLIDHSVVSGNYAVVGGGIAAYTGDVTIRDSTVSGNQTQAGTAVQEGGGVFVDSTADLTIERSTVSGNTADYGGGVTATYGTGDVTIENSTISGNHAIGDPYGGPGGVSVVGTSRILTVKDSTVTGNDAVGYAGGIGTYSTQQAVLKNSIVSGNSASADPATADVKGSSADAFDTSFSLIGVTNGYVNNLGHNLFGVSPQLGPLQNNGGPTKTRKPAATSPVINKGKAFGLDTDQRGLTRPVLFPGVPIASGGDGSDMGAVELPAPPPGPAPTPTPTPTTTTTSTSGLTGERAAALNRCKRKHKKAVKKKKAQGELTKPVKKKLTKQLRKCKRRANQLPV